MRQRFPASLVAHLQVFDAVDIAVLGDVIERPSRLGQVHYPGSRNIVSLQVYLFASARDLHKPVKLRLRHYRFVPDYLRVYGGDGLSPLVLNLLYHIALVVTVEFPPLRRKERQGVFHCARFRSLSTQILTKGADTLWTPTIQCLHTKPRRG